MYQILTMKKNVYATIYKLKTNKKCKRSNIKRNKNIIQTEDWS